MTLYLLKLRAIHLTQSQHTSWSRQQTLDSEKFFKRFQWILVGPFNKYLDTTTVSCKFKNLVGKMLQSVMWKKADIHLATSSQMLKPTRSLLGTWLLDAKIFSSSLWDIYDIRCKSSSKKYWYISPWRRWSVRKSINSDRIRKISFESVAVDVTWNSLHSSCSMARNRGQHGDQACALVHLMDFKNGETIKAQREKERKFKCMFSKTRSYPSPNV